MMKTTVILLCSLFMLTACQDSNRAKRDVAEPLSAVVSAGIMLVNGKIVTVNENFDIEEAIAVRGDRILAVGDTEEIETLKGKGTRVVDLEGKTVIPGLIDGHYHFLNKAVSHHFGVGVALVDSIDEMVQRIEEKVEQTPEGELVYTTSGWVPTQLEEKRPPSRHDLDPVSPNHPVIVQGGHSLYLNSFALEKAGITRNTVGPEGGMVVKDDETGEPTGQLVENAQRLAKKVWDIGAASHEQKLEALRSGQKKLNAVGVTSVREPGITAADMRVYQDLYDRDELTVRISMNYSLDPAKSADELIKELEIWGVSTGFGDAMLRLDGIGEFGIDGGFEGALMSEPYAQPPGDTTGDYYGLQRIPTDKFEQVMKAMGRLGWRSTSHIVGDRALDIALDAYEKANEVQPIAPKRWVVEHAHYTRPDQFKRMKDLGLLISAQFHPYMAAQNMEHFWGEERTSKVMRMRDWLDAGLTVGGGSDWTLLPANPFWIIYYWVTRDTRLGGVVGADQAITREEALRVMTINNAYITFEEDIKGTLEPGKLADLVVLSDDILSVPESAIKDISVLATIVNGQVVYESDQGLAWKD